MKNKVNNTSLESGINELALFAGGGGGILASLAKGHRIIAAVEKDNFCRKILFQRMADRCISTFPIWDDAATFNGYPFRGIVNFITAGFPCQGFSIASNKRLEEKDPRNCWPDTARIINEIRPKKVLLENVPGIRKYVRVVARDLAAIGYDCRWAVVSARAAGANHLRKRWWCLAYPNSEFKT